ncbi:MAG TPA: DMT family transporter [Frankiaceae bacterium]|jgi:drug/metabolite transporter (DMT)-like permease|nr:DMT family transporter [Frankiaceae bacterium]
MKPLRPETYSVAFVLVWSSGYVMGALATQVIEPLTVTMWRFLVAALVLAAIAYVRREQWPRGRELAQLAAIGVPMFAIQFGALYTALADGMPASTTSLIACSSPLLVAVISSAARWERLSPLRWVGIGLGVAGVATTLADRVGRPPSLGVLAWTLLGLAALAGGTALQSRVKTTAGPAAVASVEVAAAFVVLAVWAPLRGALTIPLTFHALGTFGWLALVTGVGAPLLLFSLVRTHGATRASSLLFAVPAITAIASWPILGIRPGPLTVIGLLIVAVALRLGRARTPSSRVVDLTDVRSAYAVKVAPIPQAEGAQRLTR